MSAEDPQQMVITEQGKFRKILGLIQN